MKVDVCVRVSYCYEVELPDDINPEEHQYDLDIYVDADDPVYNEITKVMHRHSIDFEGEIESIIDVETGKLLYLY